MEKLNPEKLHVEFTTGVTPTEPIIGRRYTLTHSDITAELFLTIGLEYDFDKVTQMRDEVLAEWIILNDEMVLYVYIYVDGRFGPMMSAIRDAVFRRELPLALEAIRYGDNELFLEHPELDKAPIWVQFNSSYANYNKVEKWGTLEDYK